MNFLYDNSPIIVCSTGLNTNTAISILRLSGFGKLTSLQPFFKKDLSKVINRTAHLTEIVFDDVIYDQIIFTYFPMNSSFTGEETLELSVHGNLLNIDRILKLFVSHAGFRIAHPGEFTYRALKNGKLSLSQVEGLDMLINAESTLMLNQGLEFLQGELYAQYLKLQECFIKLKSSVELSIDFSEDLGADETSRLFKSSHADFTKVIESLFLRTKGNISSLLAPQIAVVGQTNAGKSSFFNIFLSNDRSIVSNIPGTTRDYISEIVHINGTNFHIVDTAGVRNSDDQIESIGIGRSFDILNKSFFKILIINPIETNQADLFHFNKTKFDLIIFSHIDHPDFASKIAHLNISQIETHSVLFSNLLSGSIGPAMELGPMGPKISRISGSIGPVNVSGSIGPVNVSGSIGPLVESQITQAFELESSKNPILLERHRAVINKIYLQNKTFTNNIKEIDDVAIISSELNIMGNSVSELIGIVSPDDVLNSIFSNFCIGK